MPETRISFMEVLRRSQLLSRERIDRFLAELPPGSPAEGPTLARMFVEAKLLTKFQADLLLKGRYKGFILKQKYLVQDLLGAGGMGRVFLCKHLHLNRLVAVKLLSTEQAKDTSNVERFYREARAVAALDDPNIVRVYDVEHDERMPLMIMEYVDGISLHDLVKLQGALTVDQATNYIAQAALGLQHAFDVGIIHRDIKPSNLLLDRRGVLKILDMGLARFANSDDKLTERYDSNSVLGTADYLAPEQARNSSSVDIRADLYALGGTLYFLLVGDTPFNAPTVAEKLLSHQMKSAPSLRERREDVPAKLEAIYLKLMSKDPDDRFSTPQQLLDALAPFADATQPMPIAWDGQADTGSHQSMEQATPRSSQRRRRRAAAKTMFSWKKWGLIAGGVAAVALLIVGIVVLTRGSRSAETPSPMVAKAPQVDESEPKRLEPAKKVPIKGHSKKEPSRGAIPVVAPAEATKYVDRKVTVEFVVFAGTDRTKVVFLNSMQEFRSPECFTVTIFKDTAKALYPDVEFETLPQKFEGKRIRITGVVKMHMGRAQIPLQEANQMEILK